MTENVYAAEVTDFGSRRFSTKPIVSGENEKNQKIADHDFNANQNKSTVTGRFCSFAKPAAFILLLFIIAGLAWYAFWPCDNGFRY